jgi:hypothetical protein
LAQDGQTRIQLCGTVAVEWRGRRVEEELPGRQGRLLFVYLAANRLRQVRRDELFEALWGDGAPAATDGALRALLSKLRRILGGDAVEGTTGLRLVLPADARVDLEAARDAIHRAESAVALGQWERAWGASQVALFTARRGFLPGEEGPLDRRLAPHAGRALPACPRGLRRRLPGDPQNRAGRRRACGPRADSPGPVPGERTPLPHASASGAGQDRGGPAHL